MNNIWLYPLGVLLLVPLLAMRISDKPITVIEGPQALLQRPEGLAFSPTGDYLAVSNSEGSSVTLYARKGAAGAKYDRAPEQTVHDPRLLNYVHDVQFSPCGTFLSVVSRNYHSLVFYKRRGDRFAKKTFSNSAPSCV